jgi:hypothetical protein
MVYNQGFDITFDNKNEFYFAHLRYGVNNGTEYKGDWVSYCYETLVGWYKTNEGWGCFYGVKNDVELNIPTNGMEEHKLLALASIRGLSFLNSENFELNPDFSNIAHIVDRINANGLPWKAYNYEMFTNKTLGDINRLKLRGLAKRNNSIRKLNSLNNDSYPKIFNYTEFMTPARSQV